MQHGVWVGWLSSFILLLTLGKQIFKQWREGSVKGVSKWLFTGQVAAELGFVIYSYLEKDWVFVATNLALLIENFVGLLVFIRCRKKEVTRPRLRVAS